METFNMFQITFIAFSSSNVIDVAFLEIFHWLLIDSLRYRRNLSFHMVH